MEPQNQLLRERLQTGFLGIIAFALLLFLLVQARFMLICLAIAIIIFSLTSDAIGAIARRGVPNWLATTLARRHRFRPCATNTTSMAWHWRDWKR